jgi:23S rRNA (pseudouridine1915-N3)-methyltransferase
MNITILAVGKIKEIYLLEGIQEYAKRISKYCKLNIIEVSDEKAPESMSLKELEQVKDKEGEKLKYKIPRDCYMISLAIEGKKFSSEAFARKLEDIKTYNNSHIVFVIGGSNGLSKDILQRSNLLLSFSKMTFPHQLMRMILLEQIYRSFRINNNEPYHK